MAIELYGLVHGQTLPNGCLNLSAVEFVYNLKIPDFSDDEKCAVLEKILLLHNYNLKKCKKNG